MLLMQANNKNIFTILLLAITIFLSSCSNGMEKPTEKHELVILDNDQTEIQKVFNTNSKSYDPDNNKIIELVKPNSKNKKLTFLVYMTGSDLETKYGTASNDLIEMSQADVDYDNYGLLVFTGGAGSWKESIPSNQNSLIDMSGGINNIVARTDEPMNMGYHKTLSEFINYCTDRYPSDEYALIIWDHGGGPVWGCCADEIFDYDSLTLQEAKKAMDTTIFKNRQLLFVGFDACLMGSIEVATAWKDYAKYMIGSEETVPGKGWNYNFLSSIANKEDIDICKNIIDQYSSYYTDTKNSIIKNK